MFKIVASTAPCTFFIFFHFLLPSLSCSCKSPLLDLDPEDGGVFRIVEIGVTFKLLRSLLKPRPTPPVLPAATIGVVGIMVDGGDLDLARLALP